MTDRKKEILSLAQALFREKGYAATSVRDIAAAAQVEPASLYSHIKGKEELLDAICFEMADKFLKAIGEVNDIYFDAVQKLAMAVKNHIQLLTEHPDASVVFLRDWRYLSDDRKDEFIKLRDRYEEGFRAIVRKGVDEGAFNEVDVRFAALTILSSLNWVVEWYHEEGKLQPNEIADQLTKFVLTGLQKELPVTYGLVTN
ncbi:MAG: TetR/AcrR family transcriptional regulator [Flavobacteriales bacterium]|nr:TetR/AcrR family transcriptional regulator [Flavobacteriales bacterium]